MAATASAATGSTTRWPSSPTSATTVSRSHWTSRTSTRSTRTCRGGPPRSPVVSTGWGSRWWWRPARATCSTRGTSTSRRSCRSTAGPAGSTTCSVQCGSRPSWALRRCRSGRGRCLRARRPTPAGTVSSRVSCPCWRRRSGTRCGAPSNPSRACSSTGSTACSSCVAGSATPTCSRSRSTSGTASASRTGPRPRSCGAPRASWPTSRSTTWSPGCTSISSSARATSTCLPRWAHCSTSRTPGWRRWSCPGTGMPHRRSPRVRSTRCARRWRWRSAGGPASPAGVGEGAR